MVEQLGPRRRMEPSRSMPMQSREPKPPSPTTTPRGTRSVVHIPRRPNRVVGGKGVHSVNPYREPNTMRSPTRSGRATIQSMAMSVHAAGLPSIGSSSNSSNQESSCCPPPPFASECLLSPRGVDDDNDNDKRRRISPYGISRSLIKAATFLSFGFGSGYIYSNHVHVPAAPALDQDTRSHPWGYSPADPLIQKLLQHNKHEEVIQDIKTIKFPGRAPPQHFDLEDGTPIHDNNHSPGGTKKGENQIRRRVAPSPPPPKATSNNDPNYWAHNEERLVHLINKSARNVRLFWIPAPTKSSKEWVPMSDPYVENGHDFYLHARPTHSFAIKAEPYEGDAALEFTVIDRARQKVVIYDNWVLEVLDETGNNDANGGKNDAEQTVIHENAQEQHAPPQYMSQEQNSEQYWEKQRQQEGS